MSDQYILDELEKIKEKLVLDPDNSELLNDLGAGYFLLGEYQMAVDAHKKSLQIHPDHRPSIYNLANAYSELGETLKAIDLYLSLLELEPDHIPALNNLADAYEKAGDLEKTEELFRYLTRLNPENAVSRFNLGNFLLRQNRHIEAAGEYQTCIQTEPSFSDAYYNLAWILSKAGAYSKAVEYAKAGLHVNPDHEDLLKLLTEIRDKIG